MLTPIEQWHRLVASRDPSGLASWLADDAIFHSPVVHTPQAGKALVTRYLAAAIQVFGNESFRYVREIVGATDAALEFEVVIDSVVVNGVDLIRWNDAGQVTDFKVLIRPLKAVELVHRRMGELLQPKSSRA
jgi:hypothetical protein